MIRFVSLFRGINVGGNRLVRMDELKGLYATLGFKDIATYIQSGNVVCTGDDADPAQLPGLIEDAFAKKFGFHAHVIVRSGPALDAIIDGNPFQDRPMQELKWLTVVFLATCPQNTAWEDLQQAYVGPEELYLSGQDLYAYYTHGIGRSKLTLTFIEKKLKTLGSGRNWNTILQLQKMLQR
jgi:uncharacterized protein (DUF1697 family)